MKDESGQPIKDDLKKHSPSGAEEVLNVPTIQIDTPVDYSSNQPLPSELMESIKNRLPALDQVYILNIILTYSSKIILSEYLKRF